MLTFYSFLTRHAGWLFDAILKRRLKRGKEDPARVNEKRGQTNLKRPKGTLLWVHAASVGEAQSALILIKEMLRLYDISVLVTTGTKTSAAMMAANLPKGAVHQYYPLDYPAWNEAFLAHWSPDLVFWMESELWPNMLGVVKERGIPAALINARLSAKSYGLWQKIPRSIERLLRCFDMILTQTQKDATRYETLGAAMVRVSGNLKYSAQPLPVNKRDLKALTGTLMNRPVWLYASSHAGEEELVYRAHKILQSRFPNLLSIIVPRHTDRSADIAEMAKAYDLSVCMRGKNKYLPSRSDDIYIANTMGELGLLYRLAPLAVIGRSFSDDGGGGHNPIEAAQRHCAVLSGPNVQYQQEIFDDMVAANAARIADTEEYLTQYVSDLLGDQTALQAQQNTAFDFAKSQSHVMTPLMNYLQPLLKSSSLRQRDAA